MKIAFDKPVNLDGQKLVAELNSAGIVVGNDQPFSNWCIVDAENKIWLEIQPKDEQKTAQIVANHDAS